MRETERRIKAYKALLPRMKEKVIAALSLLVVAAVMMTSTTYAWIVLSTNPEVKGLQTTIAANGNLEIALAGRMDEYGKLLSPADSAVGDGLLNVVDKNLTWGNLVNLGDPAYGLETIILRPAELNENKLKTSPLFAATYGADGRVEELFSDFGYTYAYEGLFKTKDQIIKEGGDATKFKEYGVRAVSSLKFGFSEAPTIRQETLAELLKMVESSSADAKTTMQQITVSEEGNAALQSLMDLAGRYTAAEVDATLGGDDKNTSVSPTDIENLSYLFEQLLIVSEKSADALADIYNFEIYMRTDSRTGFVDGGFFLDSGNSWATIVNKLDAKNNAGETIIQTKVKQELKQLKADYQTLKNSKAQIDACKGKNNIVYTNVEGAENVTPIAGALSPVFDINSVTINNQTINQLKSSIKSNLLGAVSLLNKLTNKPDVKISAGILPRLDKFTGAKISGTYSFTIPANITTLKVDSAKVSTTAESPFVLSSESERAQGGTTDFKGDTAQAAETYGLVLDFWVRTNASNTQLTLQGAPVYETREEPVTAMIDGAETDIYRLVVYVNEDGTLAEDGTGTEIELEAYIADGKFHAYDVENGVYVGEIGPTNSKAIKSQEPLTRTVSELVGYTGVNRVWDDMTNNSVNGSDYSNSTTMGSGSCYVFYPKSADDQAKSIQLLKNLRVAFVGQDGTLFGEGVLDTEHVIEQAGKVTVPLVCHYDNPSTTIVNADGQEETIYYITDLEANTPTLVTALVYLNGKNLSNDQVLSTNDIQGHMNIQFGTTTMLGAMNDPVLREEQCNITASMTEKNGNALHPSDDITASADVRTKRIEIKVEGVEPSKVTAYFQRVINSTQGIRQNEIKFTKVDGVWVAEYTFTNAGDYILREVVLDGVTYDLDSEPIEYTLSGYAINNLYFEGGHTGSEVHGVLTNGSTYVTTDRYFTADMVLDFTRSGGDPVSIRGAFVHQETGNRTTVTFRKEGNLWRGSATVTTSGTYRLERLEIDNDTIGVPEDRILSLNLYMGVTVSVYSDKNEVGLSDEVKSSKIIMSMSVVADNDTQFKNLPPIELVYSRNGLVSDIEVLRASLVWDGQMYTGEFEVTQSGTYTFYQAKATINGNANTLYVARTAPTIVVTNVDEVPVYNGNSNLGESVFALNNDAAFSITLKDAGAATVDAKVLDKAGEPYYIRGTMRDNEDDTQTFTFLLPMAGNPLSQSGEWTLQELYLTNVFDSNGKAYNGLTAYGPLPAGDENLGDREPYKVVDGYYNSWWTWTQADMTGVDDFTVTVSSDVQIDILSTGNVEFGGTKDNPTGLFGQAHPLNEESKGYIDVKVTIDGVPIFEAIGAHPSLTMDYKLDIDTSFDKGTAVSTSKFGGGYTVANVDVSKLANTGLVDGLVNFGGDNTTYLGDGVYRLATKESLSVAGKYVPASNLKATVNVSGQDVNFTESVATAPTFTVWSKKPTVTINSVSTNVATDRYYTIAKPVNKDGMLTGSYNKKIDDYNAVVYMHVSAQSGTLDQEQVDIKQPTVTFGITDIKQYEGGTLFFQGSEPITFAQNATTAKGVIGKADDGVFNEGFLGIGSGVTTWPILYPAGKQTVRQMDIIFNGITVTMPITPITINNPLYPPYADFIINDSAFTGTIPDRVYSTDGETITLPSIEEWTNYNEATALTTKTYSDPSTSSAGTYYYDRGWWRYYTYTRTKHTQSCTVSSRIDNVTYRLQWKVGNKLYEPGEKITVSGSVNITAEITEVSRVYVKTDSVTYTKTWYTYAQTGTSKSGTEINFTPNASTKYDASNNVYDESEVVS